MSINKPTHDNFEVNFNLKGIASILIGIYLFLLSYAYKYMSAKNIDIGVLDPLTKKDIFILLAALFVTFSSLALFLSGKRVAERFQYKLWNLKTKTASYKYLLGIILIFFVLITLMNKGSINYISPAFFVLYSLFLLIFQNKARKNFLILIGLSLFLGTYCYFIPGYWHSSLTILAIAHATYGVAAK